MNQYNRYLLRCTVLNRSRSMPSCIVLMITVMLFFSFSTIVRADSRKSQPPQILLISPFSISFVQDFQMTSGLLDCLNESGCSYILDRFNADLHNGKCCPEKLAEFDLIAQKIKNGLYRVVICFGMSSVDLLTSTVKTIPDETSVIVCGVSTLDREKIPDHWSGVLQKVDITNDIELIRRLFPLKKKLVLLTNWHETGQRISSMARKAILDYPDMTLIEIDNQTVSTDDMLKQVIATGQDSVVLFQGWYNKNAVNAASLQYIMLELGNRVDFPLFVMHSAMLRYGTVGGCIEDGKECGRATAKLALKALAGNKPATFVELSSNSVLNEPMLQTYHLDQSILPDNVTVLGREDNFFVRYQWIIYLTLTIFVLIATMAGICCWYALSFRSLTWRLKTIFTNLPVNVAVIDQNENILLYYGDTEDTDTDHHTSILKLKDFALDIYPLFHEIVHKVFQTGLSQYNEYIKSGIHRHGDCIPLPNNVFGRPTVLWASVNIDELVAMSENEKLLNRCLETIIQTPDTNEIYAPMLKMICEYFKADRCYILQYNYETAQINPIEEYCASDRKKVISVCQSIKFSISEPWVKKLHKEHVVKFDVEHSSNLEYEKGGWATALINAEVKMLYTMPIYLNGELWGNWGLSFEKQSVDLKVHSLMLISSISRIFELALIRQSHYAELATALEQAKVATRMKSAFLSTMSHELRTPLNAVIGFSDLLTGKEVTPEEEKEYISGINLSGKALLGLVNNILDFSKLEANQMQIVTSPTDLNKMFQEVETIFHQTATSKGLSLKFHIANNLPLFSLDELRIRQILMNLIGNALKYTTQGAIEITAEYEDDKTLRLIVADTGIGIEPSAQKKVLEPFVQQDAIRDTKVFKGTGLGLSIVKNLVERMNGQFKLESEVNKGSVFTVILNSVESSERLPESVSNESISHNILDSSPAVLLVDDVSLNLKVLEAMLRQLNVTRIFKTESSKEALEILKKESINLVFTDLWMPEINGMELVQKIRNELKKNDLQIVSVTADAEFTDLENIFNAVLLKPFTKQRLKELLHSSCCIDIKYNGG